ncbi:DUF2052 domain containing protein [Asbolus verrucosus]|uniref:DUF2052 domain containing protein n=1 Tax=Asbolus verrucosus TaxID=1661398 RepID=A0A482VQ88_ASBVE|nr:DUF2052 domain containing protein [Asbolus verrucosus]
MEVEVDQPVGEVAEQIDRDQIMNDLTNNEEICFKSQQRGESDLTKQEKTDIALEIYNKSKLNFLVRFGKYLQKNQLQFFQQFTENCDESSEITIVLKEFLESVKKDGQINVRNRRFEALKQMVQEDSYFSEIEMMKRNPLLYEQLIGQYLTEEERKERHKINVDEQSTLVKVLLEGIERDDAKKKKEQQEEDEIGMMQEEEDSEDSDEFPALQPTYSQWGEFDEDRKIKSVKKSRKKITSEEQELLKEEFVSSMYQNFLDGKDEDFDYNSVDNNDKYDNTEMKEYDEEDKYFDSEEPETVTQAAEPEESEDELDIFMSALNQNPFVSQLSKDIQNL